MKTVVLLAFLLFAAPLAAQEICVSTLKDAPSLAGLRLGMSPAEARAVFGKSLKINVKKEGSFFENFIKKPPPPELSGVRALYLRFFDRRLYQIEIFYEKRAEPRTLEQFADSLTTNLNLPAAWISADNRKILDCGEFALVADNVLNPRVELTDKATRAAFLESEARKEAENKKNE